MARAMQLLLPGSRLRPEFVHAALVEAKRRWLGSIEEFERVVSVRDDTIGDAVFYDPPLHGDATTRWEGALHVRGMPNALEVGFVVAARRLALASGRSTTSLKLTTQQQ